jgi:hypothetical protein
VNDAGLGEADGVLVVAGAELLVSDAGLESVATDDVLVVGADRAAFLEPAEVQALIVATAVVAASSAATRFAVMFSPSQVITSVIGIDAPRPSRLHPIGVESSFRDHHRFRWPRER